MALPLMPILAGVGALTGGIQGYRQSGGDLGATALSALTGGTLTSGIGGLGKRFAGAALGKTALGKMAPQLMKAGNPLGTVLAAAPAAAGIGAAGLLGLPASAALSAPLGGATSRLAGQAAQAASGAVGVGKQVTGFGKPEIESPAQLGAIPDILSDPGLQGYLATMDPLGRAQASLALGQQYYDQNLANASRASNVTMRFQEAIKDRDFQRSAKAAELGTALATNDALRRQSQLGAQAMGQGILSGVSQAGATQYRYL
jgi:hypothetical protein